MKLKFKKEPEEPADWGPTTGYFQGERTGNHHLGKRADAELLRERVMAVLFMSDSVDAREISVGSDGETVYLSGAVPDPEMIDTAITLAASVEGVQNVVSSLQL